MSLDDGCGHHQSLAKSPEEVVGNVDLENDGPVKPASPLSRSLTKVGKWVHLARKAISSRKSGQREDGAIRSTADMPDQDRTYYCAVLDKNSSEPSSEEETEKKVEEEELRMCLKRERMEVVRLRYELDMLKEELMAKDDVMKLLKKEINKMKDVLEATSLLHPKPDSLAALYCLQARKEKQFPLVKKQGVSAESARDIIDVHIQYHDKDMRSKQLIKDAIMENDFLKNLDSSQVLEIVDCMYSQQYEKGTLVIKEGDFGSHLYVSAEGELEVRKDGKLLGNLNPGKAFGELAILYNCTRTASVRALKHSKLWTLDRKVFQRIMMKTGLQRQQDNINFLKSVPLLKNLGNDVLAKMADVLEVDFYPSGEYIIREGAAGDTFFIISNGKVKVTKKFGTAEREIRCLQRGDYFGERALLTEDKRSASVIAVDPGVECLALDRDSFKQLIGDLRELQNKQYEDDELRKSRSLATVDSEKSCESEFDFINFEELVVVSTLGVGGFGRVELVQYVKDKSLTFALKCLKKETIVAMDQQHHVLSEKKIMMQCRHSFICRLYKTYKNKKFVYMLMEACLGGEVWTYLRDRGRFDETTTRFYTGCVIEALEYLHGKNIIYRDLKPENLMLDNYGYVKLVDFGFSTILPTSKKTWTFCGTPEYVAPEIILNKGHDRAVDFWATGVLMYELFTGMPPFVASDPMETYNIILRGIDMIDFPRYISKNGQSLIKKLCRDNAIERLGYQKGGIADIKKHKWFQGFHWEGLRDRTLTPPIMPKVEGPADTRNFDRYPRESRVPEDELSGWDDDF